jgi:hypothetical protein
MTTYEFRTTTGDSIEVDDDAEIVAAEYDSRRRARSWVLVRLPSSEGVDDPTCAGNGGACSRSVENPGERCWQHSDNDA